MRQIEHPAIFEVLYPKHLVSQIQANGGIEHEVKFYEETYGVPLEASILKNGCLHIREKMPERVK